MFQRYQNQSSAHMRAAQQAQSDSAAYDQGLRTYMMKVYNYMASAILLTGFVALATAQSETLLQTIFNTPLQWVVMLAPLAFVMVLSFGINKMSSGTMQIVFWAFAATMGLSLASIFVVYTGTSIARTFFITAAAFGGLSLWGYTTKRNLSGMGSFLTMGLIGLILASVVNIFLQSSMMEFIISCIGVLIFSGLIAYDTQRIRQEYYMMAGGEMMAKGAIMSATSLYLDFVNLFMFLLRFLGNRE